MTYQLKESERSIPAMIYSQGRMSWGKLVHPMGVRPQSWLKMTMIPENFLLLEANTLIFGGPQPVRLSASEMYVPVREIGAFHLMPPFEYEPDYDPDEPNRAMKPISALIDRFRFDGRMRISTMADFSFSIQKSGVSFLPLYEVTAGHPTVPSLKSIQVPYALLRMDLITFMVQS